MSLRSLTQVGKTTAAAVFACGVALAGGSGVRAQTVEQFEQLQQIIQQQQQQLEAQQSIIERQEQQQTQQQSVIERQERQQAQQQQQIQALEQQMQALQQTSQTTERAVVETQEEVAATREEAGRAQAEAEAARALAEVSKETLEEQGGFAAGPDNYEQALGSLRQTTQANLAPPPEAVPEEPYQVSIGANLNRQVTIANDGDRTKAYFVDSTNVPTYAFLKGRARVNDDLSLGAHVEASLQDNSAAAVSQSNESSGFTIDGRFFEVTAESETYGKGSFGKGFASSFFLFETDKTGTHWANLASVGNTAPGLLFYDKNANSLSDISVGDAFLDLEALSLINRVRYDSPAWNGLQLSGTLGQDQFRDVTLRYAADTDDFDLSSALSYQNDANGPFSEWRGDGGLGILHKPTGLNLSGGAAIQEAQNDSRKSHGFQVRGGWRRDWFDFGETKTSVDFTRSWDITTNGDRSDSYGAFVVQDIDDYGLQLYTGYRKYDFDSDILKGLDDIHVWSMGMAVNFGADVSFGGPF